MANPLDAETRLAEGRPVVDDLAEYVLACHRLGYQNSDLTAHASQVRDWYDGETGLDLRALDADCVAMAAAADAAEDAARTHLGLAAELSDAWSGAGATAAREFARRSGEAATSVSSALRKSAEALATLRDELWRAVDAKVTAVQAIDGRHRAERGEWLAAARTVTTGNGDVAASSELVDQRVKPFVQNDVGSDFLGAMRTARSTIDAAYDAAITSTSSAPRAFFDVPGELGPRSTSVGYPTSGGATGSVATTVPAAAGMPTAATQYTSPAIPGSNPAWSPPPSVSAPSTSLPPSAEPVANAPLTAPAATSSLPSTGDLGGAAPALGAGTSGFGRQLADLIGSLVGSAGGAEDLAGLDGPDDEPPDELDEADADEADADEADADEADDDEADAEPDEDGTVEDVAIDGESATEVVEDSAEDPTAEPVPEPTPVPPPPAPDGMPIAAPEHVADGAEQTPCEIAADELPQVGE